MSAQLTLDCLSGIDWEHPRLEQLEQHALDYIPDCTTCLESRRSSMCVRVEYYGSVAWLRPSLERTADDRLEWRAVVSFEKPSGEACDVFVRDSKQLDFWLRYLLLDISVWRLE